MIKIIKNYQKCKPFVWERVLTMGSFACSEQYWNICSTCCSICFIEGLSSGSLAQHLVINVSMVLGQPLIRGGRCPL